MKRYVTAICILLIAVLIVFVSNMVSDKNDGNKRFSNSSTVQSHPEPGSTTGLFTFDGTVFNYDNQSYDIAERITSVNSIISCTVVGKYIIVEGHIGPNNGAYCIFNTATKRFEKDIFGNHLIWYDDDITTSIYSFWSDIYDYNGKVIGTVEMAEGSFIYCLEFMEDNTKVQATIITESGAEEQHQFDLLIQ